MAQWRNVTQNHQIHLARFDSEMYLKWCNDNGFDKIAADISKSDDWANLLKKQHKRRDYDWSVMQLADHGIVFRNSATEERVMVCHLYGCPNEESRKLEQLCREEGLTFTKLQDSWYYPGATTAYMIGVQKEQTEKQAEHELLTYKEYNRMRYRSNPRRTFEQEIRSNAKKLRALGCIVTFPPKDELNAAIDNYLANRTRRPRIDWEELTK